MKAIVLLSGGIDSPVAAYVMARAGARVAALHMDNTPYGDAKKSVARIVQQLRKETGQEIPLFIAPHGNINLSQIAQTRNEHIRCVLCKRFMMRIAEALAKRDGYGAIVMGDSMGQVASQTLRNIMVEQESVDTPIIRPLIGLDKDEIIKIAKLISTYQLSIEDVGECGIVPDKPSTRASLEKITDAEAEMDVAAMVAKCLDGITVS